MKTISAREFQLNAPKYLKELPVTITIYNRPVAVVSKVEPLTITAPQVVSKIISITPADIEEIAKDYKVPEAFVQYQLESLRNYCESSGKQYKNYKAALRSFVIRDLKNQIEKKVSKGKVVDATSI